MFLKLLLANQNWWSNRCINTKILTNIKESRHIQKKQAKPIYQTTLPILIVVILIIQRSKLSNIQTRDNFQCYTAWFIENYWGQKYSSQTNDGSWNYTQC